MLRSAGGYRADGVGRDQLVVWPFGLIVVREVPEFLRDAILKALRGEHFHVRHPEENPSHVFLASRCFQAHLDAAVRSCLEPLAGVPLPLRDGYDLLRL